MKNQKKILIILSVIIGLGLLWVFKKEASAPNKPAEENASEQVQPTSSPNQASQPFDKKQYSLDDPNSIWVIVNKTRPLPGGFAPTDLVNVGGQQVSAKAASSLQTLLGAASSAGVPMKVISGYRSQYTQTNVYNSYAQKDGVVAADRYSARPRYSEHQTGLAADLSNGTCDLEICFGNTSAGKWLESNAHKYGFIIRYPKGKESLTGYQYEPWHLRYVGKELAIQIHKTNQTLEQFFGLLPSQSY